MKKIIDKTVISRDQPRTTNVLWFLPETKILNIHSNGEWVPIGSNNSSNTSENSLNGSSSNSALGAYDIYEETVDYKQYLTWINQRTKSVGPTPGYYPEEFTTLLDSWIAAANGKKEFVVKLNFECDIDIARFNAKFSIDKDIYIKITVVDCYIESNNNNQKSFWDRVQLSWSDDLFTYNIHLVTNVTVVDDNISTFKAMIDDEDSVNITFNSNILTVYNSIYDGIDILLPDCSKGTIVDFTICANIINCLLIDKDGISVDGFLTYWAYQSLLCSVVIGNHNADDSAMLFYFAGSDGIIADSGFLTNIIDIDSGSYNYITFVKNVGIVLAKTGDNEGVWGSRMISGITTEGSIISPDDPGVVK